MKINKTNKTFNFLIPKDTFKELKIKVQDYNRKREKKSVRLKFDYTCLFLHYITYKVSTTKEKEQFGYIRLCSGILQKLHHDYYHYTKFLNQNGFIKIDKRYSTSNNECIRYKVLKPKRNENLIIYNPKSFTLRKKLKSISTNQSMTAETKCGHLTKWIHPDFLKIDYDDCLLYIAKLKVKGSEKYHRRFLLETIQHGIYGYSRNGKDNRLHTPLTNLPKDLRRFLRFKNEKLISMDIKSSQPFILAGLLHLLFIKKDYKKVMECVGMVNKVGIKNSINKVVTTMLEKSLESTANTDLRRFIKLVTEGDIYEFIGRNFSKSFLDDIQTPIAITDKFYNKTRGYKEVIQFGTMRDYCKRAMLEFLYCSPSNNEKRNKEIRKILPPIISELIDGLKGDNKSYFPIFLQNIEAHLLLDVITKRIAQKSSEIPLYTIHDSIATTEENVEFVKTNLCDGLTTFFGLTPKIEIELWTEIGSKAA